MPQITMQKVNTGLFTLSTSTVHQSVNQVCLPFTIKTFIGLDYTMSSSISRKGNSTFNDGLHYKTREKLIHKESNIHCEAQGN